MNRVLLFFIFSLAQTGLSGQLVSFGSPWENPVGRNLLFSNDTAWYLASGTWPSAPHQSIQVHQFTLPAAGPPLLFQHITHTFPLYGEELLRFPDGRWLVVGAGFPLNSPPQGFHAILLPDGSLDTLQFTSFPNRLVQWKRGAILTNDLFYLTGTISQENGGGNDVYLALWHRTQGILWDRSLGTADNETALAHFLLPDSSLIIVADKTAGGSVKQSFSRTQIDGFTQWEIDGDYPLSHGAQSLALMNDSILVCIGESTVPGIAGFDVLLSQLHIEGRLIRHIRLGGAGTDAGFWISQGNTGQWWLAGYSNSHDLNAPTAPFFSELSADWSQIKTQIWPSTELCFPRSLQVVPVQDSLHIFFAAAGQTQHFYLSETLQLIPSSLFQITDDVLPIKTEEPTAPIWMTPEKVGWPSHRYEGMLEIFSITGQKLVEWDVEKGSTEGLILPEGLYVLQWKLKGVEWPRKVWIHSD